MNTVIATHNNTKFGVCLVVCCMFADMFGYTNLVLISLVMLSWLGLIELVVI